jgi:hypothetical protein
MRLALATHPILPSAYSYGVGTPEGLGREPEGMDFAAQYLARTFPCQRFTAALTGRGA